MSKRRTKSLKKLPNDPKTPQSQTKIRLECQTRKVLKIRKFSLKKAKSLKDRLVKNKKLSRVVEDLVEKQQQKKVWQAKRRTQMAVWAILKANNFN